MDDLGGSLGNAPTSEGITLEAQVNPLVSWIWYGALVFTFGSLIGLWPSGEGLPGPRQTGKKQPATPPRDEEESERVLVGAD